MRALAFSHCLTTGQVGYEPLLGASARICARLVVYRQNSKIYQRLSREVSPMKDNKGHGSNKSGIAAHAASHGPTGVKHGSYGNGSEFHGKPKRVWVVNPQSTNGPFEQQIRRERSGVPDK